jgi:hypothetical protein
MEETSTLSEFKKLAIVGYYMVGVGLLLWLGLDSILVELGVKEQPDTFFNILRLVMGVVMIAIAVIRSKWSEIVFPRV